MTRLFWFFIAMFPLPVVIMLIAGPPELFDAAPHPDVGSSTLLR